MYIFDTASLENYNIVIPNGFAMWRRNEESQIDVAEFSNKKMTCNYLFLK